MTPETFKNRWSPDELNPWMAYDPVELEKSPLQPETKTFLKYGFPLDAAPWLRFIWENTSLYDFYKRDVEDIDEDTKNYSYLGSDGEGNPICFDLLNKDRVILLDHEMGFEIMDVLNNSIEELAHCLLIYKDFFKKIQNELGEDAFLESKFTVAHVNELKEQFLTINSNIFNESSFWNHEIQALLSEANGN